MSAPYDKDYQTPDLFGQPHKELVAFFDQWPHKGTVLDLGCGQGRDSIALAQLGYEVTGVDISQVGIDQMVEKAAELGLEINGQVADIYSYSYPQHYDIVVLDSMIHFDKQNKQKELQLLQSAADHSDMLCICIWKDEKRRRALLDFFNQHEVSWETLSDIYFDYFFYNTDTGHSSKTVYNMVVMRRVK